MSQVTSPVERFYACLAAGDRAGALGLLDPDIEWNTAAWRASGWRVGMQRVPPEVDLAVGKARQSTARRAVQYDDDELDRDLVKRIALQDHVAFRELNSRYRQRVARFVSRVTSRSDMIDEVTNETLWIVWKSAGRFRGGSKVSSWILGIARHTGNRAFRNSVYRRSIPHVAGQRDEESGEPWSHSETCEWLAAGLSRLPVTQRTVLELAYFVGHSCEEIAQRVNCPVNTVKTRLFHARRKMRALLLCL